MTRRAAERAEWGARITNDDWGTHPTIAYGVMLSAAFFEKDVEKLVQMAIDAVPNKGPYAEGIRDVVKWHKQYDNWRDTRKRIHEKYYRYKKGSYEAPVSVVSSLNNGLCGIMAILYGQGDFMKTVGIAVSAGYDCDNQAATCGGLIGVLQGSKCIPENLTEGFNDQYVCFTRDNLPVVTPISNIVKRTAKIAKTAIMENGGRVEIRPGEATSIAGRTLMVDFEGDDLEWSFGEKGKVTISGGRFESPTTVSYEQDGQIIRVNIKYYEDYEEEYELFYDGKTLVMDDGVTAGDITYIINCDF